jgi:dynein heavy chain
MCVDRYITPDILEEDYKFSETGKYFAPPESNLDTVRQFIKALPLHDPPSTFGLHDNADLVFQQNETNNLLTSIISIQPRVSKLSGGKSPDDVVAELAKEIESRLPPNLDQNKAHPTTFATIADGSMNSLGVFLLNEMLRFNKLLNVLRSTLKELQRAIKGLVVMSGTVMFVCLFVCLFFLCVCVCFFFCLNFLGIGIFFLAACLLQLAHFSLPFAADLETMYTRFLYNMVPLGWEKAAYPSLKPLASWVDDLILRLQRQDSWLRQGTPTAFWVSGFFFPQGFMTAVLQVHSRKNRIAIDTLKFRTTVQNISPGEDTFNIPQAPEIGMFFF